MTATKNFSFLEQLERKYTNLHPRDGVSIYKDVMQ